MGEMKSTKKSAHWFFYGAGFIASFAAIGNLIDIETVFHKQLEEVRTFLKFWGTKVLVSIAFLQSLLMEAMPPFSQWSETRRTMMYCAMLCLECFIVAIVHLQAWSPYERWYLFGVEDIDISV